MKKKKAEERAQKQKFECPYCAKQYKSKSYIGAQKHLLQCSKKNRGQLKLKSYFKS